MREKDYPSLCLTQTLYKSKKTTMETKNIYPTCVYFDSAKQKCELGFCYRALKERGKKK